MAVQLNMFEKDPAPAHSVNEPIAVNPYFSFPNRIKTDSVEIVPFGRFSKRKAGAYSVEQVAFEDYKYFQWIGTVAKKDSLIRRIKVVNHALEHFVSQLPCACCKQEPARLASLARGHDGRSGSAGYVYCSSHCFREDPQANYHRVELTPLKASAMFSSTKAETNHLMEIIADCMGLSKGRKSKEYLHEAINNMPLWTEYK